MIFLRLLVRMWRKRKKKQIAHDLPIAQYSNIANPKEFLKLSSEPVLVRQLRILSQRCLRVQSMRKLL